MVDLKINELGKSKIEDETDFSIETLVKDTIEVLRYISSKFPTLSIIVVGHSMGGSVATKAVKEILTNSTTYSFYKQIRGFSVIDVVEGSAIDALQFMDKIISDKPKTFPSMEEAIKWQ